MLQIKSRISSINVRDMKRISKELAKRIESLGNKNGEWEELLFSKIIKLLSAVIT